MIAGINFLESHPGMQKTLKVDEAHVIVDRAHWELAIKVLQTKEGKDILNKISNEQAKQNNTKL